MPGCVAAGRDVADFEKAGEALVGRQHLFADGGEHLRLDALLLRGGDRGGKLLQRHGEGRVFRFLVRRAA